MSHFLGHLRDEVPAGLTFLPDPKFARETRVWTSAVVVVVAMGTRMGSAVVGLTMESAGVTLDGNANPVLGSCGPWRLLGTVGIVSFKKIGRKFSKSSVSPRS
jgi:hypothetical protein